MDHRPSHDHHPHGERGEHVGHLTSAAAVGTVDHKVPEHPAGHDQAAHGEHHGGGNVNSMAASATLHCLTGCAIGEVLGLMIGTAIGLSAGGTIALEGLSS